MSEVSEKVAQLIYVKMANSPLFPFDKKTYHRNKPHMKDVALLANTWIPIDENTHVFELGNDLSEEKAPQYHILEDAQSIHYGNRRARRIVKNKEGKDEVRAYGKVRSWGTEKSKGSQAKVSSSSRDYGKWSYSDKGKLTQEYRGGGTKKVPTVTSTAYENKHYHYIERIMEVELPSIAINIGAKLGRGSEDFWEEMSEATENMAYASIASMIGKTTI